LVLVNLYEDSPDAKAGGVVIVLLGGLILGIIQLVLLTTQGQTIGKRIVSVRIVCNDTGENPGFLKAVLLRAIVNGLIAAIPGVGAFYSLVDILFIFGNERRCIHDMIAGTRVVEA
jgi:uncharacterized RDD family membrane protein YckC